jgi:hypothetical protein
MMAAGTAASRGKSVLLIEKNKRLGEKLRITGGGRCNVTNNERDSKKLLSRYGSSEQVLYSPFASFGITDTFAFFESHDLPLVTESLNRSFPYTFKASDIEQVLENYCKENKVTILSNTKVIDIILDQGKITGITTDSKDFFCNNLIIATGGFSHPETGSTGDGFTWLKKIKHTIIPPTPSIVPIAVHDDWIKKLSGTTLPDVKIDFYSNGSKKITKRGNILLTHFGLSGPLILNSATAVNDLLHQGTVTGIIDLFPKKDIGTLDKELIILFNSHKNKVLKNVLKEFITPALVNGIKSFLPTDLLDTQVNSITKIDRRKIIDTVKSLSFTVDELLGFDKAVVADGGVPLSEINMKTMQSIIHSNLYIVGDLLHVNRPSGGFSLQLCWTTGYVAGKNI